MRQDPLQDERLIGLETKLAFFEDANQQLSDVVARQQRQIDALEAALRILIERVENLNEPAASKGSLIDEIPPHY